MQTEQQTPQHQWLERLIGEWTYEHEASAGPDQPPMKLTGTEKVRSLGGLWVLCEGSGEMPGGGNAHSIMTLGFDPTQSRFVGTFIASMMTHLWIYSGSLDAEQRVLTLDTMGPTFSEQGGLTSYKDIIEFLSDDHRQLRSEVQQPDGTWSRMMTANYYRTK